MLRPLLLCVLVGACFVGCAARLDHAKASALPDWEVLTGVSDRPSSLGRPDAETRSLLWDEIRTRGLLTDEEFAAARNRKLRVGMSERVVLAVHGNPNRLHRDEDRAGWTRTYVYDHASDSTDSYSGGHTLVVYVRNGTISSISRWPN